jgi:hypothetical protein
MQSLQPGDDVQEQLTQDERQIGEARIGPQARIRTANGQG